MGYLIVRKVLINGLGRFGNYYGSLGSNERGLGLVEQDGCAEGQLAFALRCKELREATYFGFCILASALEEEEDLRLRLMQTITDALTA